MGVRSCGCDIRILYHWNEDDPPQVPPNCGKCHSGNGFIDYIGQDGSLEFSVDRPAAVESVVACVVCHSEKGDSLSLVKFPSGAEINFGIRVMRFAELAIAVYLPVQG